MAGPVARGDVWLCEFPEPDKRRPVLVLSRGDALRVLRTAIVAPITSTIHGLPSEVVLDVEDGMKARCAVNLDHTQLVTQVRFVQRVAHLSDGRLAQVCRALAYAAGCR